MVTNLFTGKIGFHQIAGREVSLSSLQCLQLCKTTNVKTSWPASMKTESISNLVVNTKACTCQHVKQMTRNVGKHISHLIGSSNPITQEKYSNVLMSTNQISKPVEDSNTEGNKIKEFEYWIMYFVIEKSDADAVCHFFIFYGSLLTIEATYSKLVCYFTPRSSSF